jgi:hypothetical protein
MNYTTYRPYNLTSFLVVALGLVLSLALRWVYAYKAILGD